MLYAIVAVIGLILDQALKYWTSANITLNTGYKELIPKVVHLTNVHNDGAAFSMLAGARWFFVALCLVFLVAVIFLLRRNIVKSPGARWMLVAVLSGALGNCIDRVISGYVVDMIELGFKVFGRSFPVFNLADIFITVGGILFCIFFLLEPDSKKAEAAGAEEKSPAAARPAPAKKPRRQKLVIPDFPKHEHSAGPAIDPNDPFAEWERMAAEKSQPKKAPAQPASQSPAPVRSAQPSAAQKPVQPIRPAAPAQPKPAPVQPAPAPQKPAEKSAPADDGESYDLDDILAEFKDL